MKATTQNMINLSNNPTFEEVEWYLDEIDYYFEKFDAISYIAYCKEYPELYVLHVDPKQALLDCQTAVEYHVFKETGYSDIQFLPDAFDLEC